VFVHGLIEDGVPTAKFLVALSEVFKRFDKDGDGGWKHEELDAFHRQVNGTPVSQNVEQFLTTNFSVNSRGYLTENGLVTFYLAQTQGEAAETWKDFRQLGYDNNLNRTTQ